jgi:hypothetical protein
MVYDDWDAINDYWSTNHNHQTTLYSIMIKSDKMQMVYASNENVSL